MVFPRALSVMVFQMALSVIVFHLVLSVMVFHRSLSIMVFHLALSKAHGCRDSGSTLNVLSKLGISDAESQS